MTYTIRQVSDLTGLSASTLRYYEAERLLQPVQRNSSNRRMYGEGDMDWLSLISCLKNTGMPIQNIRRFVALCGQGDSTLQERYRIVLSHKRATEQHIADLQKELAHINYKAAYYQAACEAGTEAELKKLKYPENANCCFDYLQSKKEQSTNAENHG